MINSLTQKQIDSFPKYVDKYVQIGLNTKKQTLAHAKKIFNDFQRYILKIEKPAEVVLLDSPYECNILAITTTLKKILKEQKIKLSTEEFNKTVQKTTHVYPYFDGQFWASWFAYYDFFKENCGVEYVKEYDILRRCVDFSLVFPLEDVCIVCQPPSIIKKNANGLHCENGPALSFNGKNEIYALNGVIMKKEHVMTLAENLNPKDIIAETNVEVRRELIRKMGIALMLEHLTYKVIDKKDNYELLDIHLSDEVSSTRYLKMINPSIQVFHLEGVEGNSVQEALNWRAKQLEITEDWKPSQLT